MTSDGLQIPYVWSTDHAEHDPGGEVWVGVRIAGTERPERADAIRAALRAAGGREIAAEDHPDSAILRVHDASLLTYLAGAWDAWEKGGLAQDPGQDRVVPYLFPHPELLGGLPVVPAASEAAEAGRFAYDTMTLIGPGTWTAARGAANAALTAADLVLAGERLAYACCRPPGHHATAGAVGGSCYLNNAAIAAAHLRASLDEPVAIIDIDAHHGNGSQSIFYGDPAVLTGSVHVNPGAGWFPHFLGFEGERGRGEGAGSNRNLVLDPGAGDAAWLDAVVALSEWAAGAGARALIVALGVDAAPDDPEGPLRVSQAGYHEAGRALAALEIPIVAVQEGGYDLETLGDLVLSALSGLASGD